MIEWLEADPLPPVCQECERKQLEYEAADEAGKLKMEEDGFFFDCGSCDHGGERFYLSHKDELLLAKKGKEKMIERLQREIAEIDRELAATK